MLKNLGNHKELKMLVRGLRGHINMLDNKTSLRKTIGSNYSNLNAKLQGWLPCNIGAKSRLVLEM